MYRHRLRPPGGNRLALTGHAGISGAVSQLFTKALGALTLAMSGRARVINGNPGIGYITTAPVVPVWSAPPVFSITEGVPITLPIPVAAPGYSITIAWVSPGVKPSWVTLNSGLSPSISFSGAQVDANDIASLVLSATANGTTVPSTSTPGTGSITVNPTVPLGLSLTVMPSAIGGIPEGWTSVQGTVNGTYAREARPTQMLYESAYATKDGTMIEHADGAHGVVRWTADLTQDLVGSGNRVGEFVPSIDGGVTPGRITEVYPENREDHGVQSYDNTIYLYFDAIDSLVQFNGGAFSRRLSKFLPDGSPNPSGDTMVTRTWTGPAGVTDPYPTDAWSPSKGSTSNAGISAWTHIQNQNASERFPRLHALAPPPSGRPPLYSADPNSNALMYTYGWFDGIAQQFAWFNVHSAYSRLLDCAIIIGGASATNQVEAPSLSIIIPSSFISPTIRPRYSVLFTQMSKAACVVDGARWMLDSGRAGCKFYGNYVYWGGGGDQGQSGGGIVPYFFRADLRPVLANPTAPLTSTFLPERLADLPWPLYGGALTVDPFTNAMLMFAERGIALYNPAAGSWSGYATRGTWTDVTSSFPEFVNAFASGHTNGTGVKYINNPHADFINYRGTTQLRKTYFFGGWNYGDSNNYTERYRKIRSIKLSKGSQISAVTVVTEDPATGLPISGPLLATKHLALIENFNDGYNPGEANRRITLFGGDWDYGWPSSSRADYPPIGVAWNNSDGRQEMWDADVSDAALASGTIRMKLAQNFYHNYPWNGSTGYSGAGGFGGVEPQRGPYMPDGLGFIIDKRGDYWMGPCDVGYTAPLGDAAGEQFGAWAPMYKWNKPGVHPTTGIRLGNGWTRPNQNRLKRRGAANQGYTTPADWDVGIASDSEAVGWGRPNTSAYDPANDCIWVVGVNISGGATMNVALYKFPCVPTGGVHTWTRHVLASVSLKALGGPNDGTGNASTGSGGDGDICNIAYCNGALYFTHTQQFTVSSRSDWASLNGYIGSTTRRMGRIIKVNLNGATPSSSTLEWIPFPEASPWWLRAYDGPEGGEAQTLGYVPLTTSQYRSLKAVGTKLVVGPDVNIKVAEDPWICVYDTVTKIWTTVAPPASHAITNGGHDWPLSIFSVLAMPSLGEVWLAGKAAPAGSTPEDLAYDAWKLSKGMYRGDAYQGSPTSPSACGRRIIRIKV